MDAKKKAMLKAELGLDISDGFEEVDENTLNSESEVDLKKKSEEQKKNSYSLPPNPAVGAKSLNIQTTQKVVNSAPSNSSLKSSTNSSSTPTTPSADQSLEGMKFTRITFDSDSEPGNGAVSPVAKPIISQQEFLSMKKRVEELEKEKTNWEKQKQELENNAKQQVAFTKSRFEKSIENMKNEHEALSDALKEEKTRNSELEHRISILGRAPTTTTTTSVDKDKIQQLNREITDLKSQLNEANRLKDIFEQECDRLRKEMDKSSKSDSWKFPFGKSSKKPDAKQLEKQNLVLQSEIETLKVKLKKYETTDAPSSTTSTTDHKILLKNLQNERDSFQKQLQEKEQELITFKLQQQRPSTPGKSNKDLEESSRLKAENERYSHEIIDLVNEVSKLKRALDEKDGNITKATTTTTTTTTSTSTTLLTSLLTLVKTLVTQHSKLKMEWQQVKNESQSLKSKIALFFSTLYRGMSQAIEKQDKRVTGSVKKYKSEFVSRRSLLEKLSTLKGNSRVYCVTSNSSLNIPIHDFFSVIPTLEDVSQEISSISGMSFEGGSICYLTFSDRPLTYSKNSGNNLVSLLFQFFALLTEKTKDHKYQLNASAFGIRNNQLVDILSDDPIVVQMSKDFRFTPPPTSISTSSSHEEFAEIFDFAIQSPVFADDPSKTIFFMFSLMISNPVLQEKLSGRFMLIHSSLSNTDLVPLIKFVGGKSSTVSSSKSILATVIEICKGAPKSNVVVSFHPTDARFFEVNKM